MIHIICFFWVDSARRRSYQISPEDVRVWDSMVARNVTVPHHRLCVTHRPDLVGDFISTIPLDLEKHVPGTCLVKLQAHKIGGVAKEGDRVLLMDIDCVVTGNLDPLITGDPYRFWLNPNFAVGGKRGFIQGSMQLFTVGETAHLWREFDPKRTPGWLNRRFGGGEQAWISERMNLNYPEPGWEWDVATWDESHGVYGAGRLVNGKMGEGVQSELPANARIVFCPGDRSPSQPEMQARHPWIRDFWR